MPVISSKKIGLIAGNGSLPLLFADSARRQGYAVFAIAHEQETDAALSERVEDLLSIPVGQFEKMVSYFKAHDVTDIVMGGGIPKRHLLVTKLSQKMQSLITPFREKKDDTLLRAFASELEREHLTVRAITEYMPSWLAEEGEMTRPLTENEREDIRWGWRLAKQIGALDIGQCVVVRDGILLAVEAIEGTDATIRRGGALAEESAVVIKCLKPHQDIRLDLPTVGPKTLETMIEVKASTLAIEAGATLVLEKESFLKLAREAGIAVVGWQT